MATVRTADRLLTLQEVAGQLGLTATTLYRWRSHGEGPRGFRLRGGTVRYRQADVDSWLDSQADQPRQPVA